MQVINCGCFCLSQCRFSLFYITFRLLSSVSSITALNIIHLLATFTERSIVHALLFFPYFELLPLATLLFFTSLVSKNPFWSSLASFDPVRIFSLLFPQKSSVLSRFLIPLLCSQCHWFYSHVSITHTSLLHVAVHIPIHIPHGLECQKLKAGACHTLCSMRLWLACPPFLHLIRMGKHTAFIHYW